MAEIVPPPRRPLIDHWKTVPEAERAAVVAQLAGAVHIEAGTSLHVSEVHVVADDGTVYRFFQAISDNGKISADDDIQVAVQQLFSSTEVENLNRYQHSGVFHEFTCGKEHGGIRTLRATGDGWVCDEPGCDYTQNWAHEFMLNFTAEKEAEHRAGMMGLMK